MDWDLYMETPEEFEHSPSLTFQVRVNKTPRRQLLELFEQNIRLMIPIYTLIALTPHIAGFNTYYDTVEAKCQFAKLRLELDQISRKLRQEQNIDPGVNAIQNRILQEFPQLGQMFRFKPSLL